MSNTADRPRFGREERVLHSAAFASGPMEVLDFLLPLYAGAVLAAAPGQAGALVAVCALAALLTRPLSGHLADRVNELLVAAAGAVLHAAALAGFALSIGLPAAFAMAALTGVGSGLFWVGVRSWIGARAGDDDGRGFGRLLSFEGTGQLIAYIICFTMLEDLGYPAVFALGAASALIAAAMLGFTARGGDPRPPAPSDPVSTRDLLPFLGICGVTAALEAAMGLLLLLHLQTAHHYGPYAIASALAPGFIAFILVPNIAHRVLTRIGKRTAVMAALLASALVTGVLAAAPEPWVLSVVWIFAAAALGIAVPAEQSAISERAGARIATRLSHYESAQLAGVAAGTAAIGALYQAAGIAVSGAVAAVALAITAAAVPVAWRSLTSAAALRDTSR
ncbi:MFS transporter [Saccharopolyspora flava]|uniref:Predicted arabinose efflux permease, MFS family n=1 Tax=Saccharopolyspora flava TaxID=95161 RepID=A0A1I6RMD2_9PSEU|nr:MFS transporter [Saccharopolyspora flava]SFS65877.1 Predicted arabinose efflux permease, MFS family [Saccharopolyspora flava]